MKYIFILFSFIFVNNGSSQNIPYTPEDVSAVNETIANLSLEEKIAQFFMVDISPKESITNARERGLTAIKKYGIGGVIIMKSDYASAKELLIEFQSKSKIPLMTAIDGEWGINMRIPSAPKYPYQLGLGAIQDNSLIEQMGESIGLECRKLGIQINFAPVADINTNPNNPVINYRSFGENKYNVTAKARAYAMGLQKVGIMACMKHFPGHGDTDGDSHFGLPKISKSRKDLDSMELYPFKALVKSKIWSAMIAHLNVPALDASGKPSSLSYPVITELLKNQMGFDGLVFSDALNMKGASTSNEPGQIELDAYLAGNDILLYSPSYINGIKKIKSYLKSNPQYVQDFESRLFKIMLYKRKLAYSASLPNIGAPMQENELIQKLYDNEITFLSSTATPNSLNDLSQKTLYVSIGDNKNQLIDYLKNISNIKVVVLSKDASEVEFNSIIAQTGLYQKIIIAYHDLSQTASKQFGLNSTIINFIDKINQKPNVYNLWFGNPYGLKFFQNANHVVVGYEDNSFTHRSLVSIFENELLPKGRLPVSVGKFHEGDYVKKPEPVKIDTVITPIEEPTVDIYDTHIDLNTRIQNLCLDLVNSGAAPGFQLVVLKNGKKVYDKSYGYFTYSPTSPQVKNEDIYDLASLTKIMSTTLAAMKLYEEGKLDLNSMVGQYLNLPPENTISNIFIRQLLTHEAGLTPFIPFYLRFNTNNYMQYFRFKPEPNFTTQVANRLYIRDDYKDSMWYDMTTHARKNVGEFRYSDLSMYVLQRIIEKITNMPLDVYVSKTFYQPMKLNLFYTPIDYYAQDKIAPTENDQTFRFQVLQGFVHDPGCALYGGVCGHAGLFGNANDVSKIMQMLINGGEYNGVRYFKPTTVDLFTKYQGTNSHRGFGFDKPDYESGGGPTAPECSIQTFGHTGFTGTCAWADPAHKLVFVFLSNRVYPSSNNKRLINGNYRTRLQSLFYQLPDNP